MVRIPAPTRPSRALLPAALVAVLAGAAALPAQARRFGPALNQSVNVGFGCTTNPTVPDAFGNPTLSASGASTCTWAGFPNALNRGGAVVPLGKGIVTRVRVKTGPRTGPMRIVVLRTVVDSYDASHKNVACCREVGRSRIFRPRPNRVVAVRTRLRVTNTGVARTSTGFGQYDAIGVSLLSPRATVPLHYYTGTTGLAAPIAIPLWPAIRPRELRAVGGGSVGFVVLLNGDWRRRR